MVGKGAMIDSERRATKQRAVEKDKAVAKLLTDGRYCIGCGENYKLSKGHNCSSKYSIDLHSCDGCSKLYKLSEGHSCKHVLFSQELKAKYDQIQHNYYYGEPVATNEPECPDRECLDCGAGLSTTIKSKVRCHDCWLHFKYPHVHGATERKCVDCGMVFEESIENWKVRCLDCWKSHTNN